MENIQFFNFGDTPILPDSGVDLLAVSPQGAHMAPGYRSRRARASQEAWQFAQNVAGQIWFGLGLVQTVVFAWVCLGMQTWSVEAQCQAALISILVEDVLVLLSMIPTEVLLVRRFGRRSASRPSRDRRGTR